MTGRTLLGLGLGLLLVAAGLVFACGDEDDGMSSGGEGGAATSPAAARFLRDYVEPGGRVVRPDEGGDTVSEGQSYGLLLAVGAGDDERFSAIWDWTRENLQRDDGLFAWRWAGGAVVDESPAADADVDIAAALRLAADRWDRPGWEDEARRIADAAMEHETFPAGDGRLLAAGPWAVDERVVNPSYLARCDWDDLADLTGDERWSELGDAADAALAALAEVGLPPDWARASDDGTLRPVSAADASGGPGRYGLDAARIPIRLAGCPDDTEVAASLWTRLSALDHGGAGIAYSLDGAVVDATRHPLGLVGAAASAAAADHPDDARRLLDEARALADETPTYYGAAWLAFGETILAADAGLAAGIELVGFHQEQPTTTTFPATTTSEPTTTAPTSPTTSSPTSTDGSTSTTITDGSTSTTAPDQGPTTTAPGDTTTSTTPAAPGDLSEPGTPEALPGRGSPDEPPTAERARRTTATLALAGLALAGLAATVTLGATLGLHQRRATLSSRST